MTLEKIKRTLLDKEIYVEYKKQTLIIEGLS